MAGRTSKYSQIVEKLQAEIQNGTYGLGDMLPAEHRLMQAYGVSRHTVRQALQHLKQSGIIEAQQGKGSIVISANAAPAFVDKIQSIEALIEKGGSLTRRIISTSQVKADAALAAAFDTDMDREFTEIHLLRYSQEDQAIPVAYLKVWVDPLFQDISNVLESDGRTVVELMKVKYDHEIGSIRQTISACNLDETLAGHLQIAAGDCALQIERRYYQTSLSHAHLRTISICRGDMVQIQSHFLAS